MIRNPIVFSRGYHFLNCYKYSALRFAICVRSIHFKRMNEGAKSGSFFAIVKKTPLFVIYQDVMNQIEIDREEQLL